MNLSPRRLLDRAGIPLNPATMQRRAIFDVLVISLPVDKTATAQGG
jgi:hypothetical protein